MTLVVPDDDVSVPRRAADQAVWRWRPGKATWFERFGPLAEGFALPPVLRTDPAPLRFVLHRAARAQAAWLYHPALAPIFRSAAADDRPRCEPAIGDALHLAVWAAAHAPDLADDWGTMRVPPGASLWTPEGPVTLAAGHHDLSALGSMLRARMDGPAVALDPLGLAIDLAAAERWDGDDPASADAIAGYLHALAFCSHRLPHVAAWIGDVARLVVPFRHAPGRADFRSASDPQVPGLIRMDLGCGLVLTLEALVHESAHHYFYLIEADGAIVAPEHTDRRFRSPLKPEPRPLRGLMLAFHALAHIAALYDEIGALDIVADRAAFDRERDGIRTAARAARITCADAADCLTPHGRHLLDRTSDRVFAHAR